MNSAVCSACVALQKPEPLACKGGERRRAEEEREPQPQPAYAAVLPFNLPFVLDLALAAAA